MKALYSFLRDFSEDVIDTVGIDWHPVNLALVGQKALFLTIPLGAFFTQFFAAVFNKAVIVACIFVIFMWFVDVITGVVYHVFLKQPPDDFDKTKVYKSLFEFLLLLVFVIAFSIVKYFMLLLGDTVLAFAVPAVDGGITGIFMTLQFLIFLVLLKDFIVRSKEMGMPGAAELSDWLDGIINRVKKKDGGGDNPKQEVSKHDESKTIEK